MKIAIIGSGISGLGISWLLHNNNHQITLFEKNNYLGGHANTVEIDYPVLKGTKKIAVDTGFIVYNFRTYHHLKSLFEHLKVKIKESKMSFAISIDDKFEYSAASLLGLFGNQKNLFDLKFWRMLFDIIKFNYLATKLLKNSTLPESTLEEFIDKIGVGQYFKQYYLFAMASAIWSCPIEMIKNYPAKSFLQFFYNHGLLTIFNQPKWYTIEGGSKQYVEKISENFKDKIKLNLAITKVYQQDNKIIAIDQNNQEYQFDQVIFACHAPDVLEILQDATNQEKDILSNFKYSQNIAILHRDITQMPVKKTNWASWVYLASADYKNASLSYWMNNLQKIDHDFPLFVTLNPKKEIKKDLIFGQYNYSHPIFDLKAIEAQEKIDQIQGKRNIWFCGAYTKYGFHEDGLSSAIKVANRLKIKAPWQK